MALSSSGTSARRWEYQVFLSFRGTDTRTGFVSHLYDKLHNLRGIRTFKDDHDLERGTTISPELLRAIEQSQFAIIVFSENYAFSSWCLDELTKIVQSMEAGKILPVFYKVEPTIVRKLTGSFAQALMEHGTKFSQEKVGEWRAALKSVAGIAGWHVDGNKPESDLIDEVVNRVWEQVRHTFKLFNSPDKFVGRDFALKELMGLLALGENDVRFIGITGMGGIGKTTLARIVFDSISGDYDVRCFLANVREVSEREGTVVGLQKKLLSPILKEKVKVRNDEDGAIFIAKCLWNKKFLLVLDDVDHLKQLQKLAGGKDWFGNGSRIIFTTRNHRLLVERDISLSYEVEEMSDDEALELFSLNAFKKDQPDEEFLKLSNCFVKYAKGVPLVLHIMGSLLYRRDGDAWNSILVNLKNNPRQEVFDVLKISYDGLQAMEQKFFLDIACFHKGKHLQEVIGILNRRFDNISSLIMIDTLIERSLLTMSYHNYLEMHDLIQDMGREIVLQESKAEPGKRTRIWRFDDLHHVLTFNTGTEAIEVIVVNSPKLEEIWWDFNAFSNMRGLKHIKLYNVKINFSAPIWLQHFLRIIHWRLYPWDPICLPPSLRIISWYFFSLEFLPQSFLNSNLTELRMPGNKLVRLWDGKMESPNLKIIDLGGSYKLTTTPDFTGVPNLEILKFHWSKNLVDIHASIAVLKRLKVLTFEGCKRIKSLPSKFEMDSLEELNLQSCSKLKKVPEFSKQMKTLSLLRLSFSAIKQLPSSIVNLLSLQSLCLHGSAIEQLPSSIGNIIGLSELYLSETAIKQLPSSIENLVDLSILYLGRTAIVQLPSSIGNLTGLRVLNLERTPIERLPSSIGNIVGLSELYLSETAIKQLPSSIENLFDLSILYLDRTAIKQLPSSIGNLTGLRELNLERTPIERLPSSIGNLTGLRKLNLKRTPIERLPSSIGNLVGLIYLNLKGSKRLCVADLNQHLNRFRCLEILDLSDCNLGEGAIPEDIGCLSSLKWLMLGGNHFVTLPAIIQCLSKLEHLGLNRCESLRELPPLPPPRLSSYNFLYVNVCNCTSLQRLTDPSKLSGKFASLYDFRLSNCMRLVEDEGFINYVRSKMVRWIISEDSPYYNSGLINLTYPASEIPEWFDNKSEEAGDWLGIAICFVWASEKRDGNVCHNIECSSGLFDPGYLNLFPHLGPEHVTMFYRSRKECRKECHEVAEAEFSFKAEYYDEASGCFRVDANMVKKWAARWVYKHDLEDLQQRLKVLKRTHEYYGEEAGPSGSDAMSDDEEPNRKRQKKDWAALDIESE